MSPVLLIADSEPDPARLQRLLADAGLGEICVTTRDGLSSRPSFVLCDMVARGVASDLAPLQQQFHGIPLVILTDPHCELSAKKAIEAGVAGCLPRDRIERDLPWTLRGILGSCNGGLSAAADEPMCYTIDNNPELLPLIVSEIRRRMADWPFHDPIELVRVTVALSESLDNALYHGNLELSSDLRQGDGRAWRSESLLRRRVSPYSDRRIRIQGSIGPRAARFTISDEGPGFDVLSQRDCTQAGNLELCSGRGLLLMRMYMDETRFNESGNEVTLVKLRPEAI